MTEQEFDCYCREDDFKRKFSPIVVTMSAERLLIRFGIPVLFFLGLLVVASGL